MENGDKVLEELKGDRDGGMPWMVILDGEGNELITSNGPDGNVGCPVEPNEIKHFVDMIRKSSDATDEHLQKITDAMNANAEKIKSR